MGIKKWMLRRRSEGQVKNGTQEREDVWKVLAASPADALRICREKIEGGAEGSSTYCSLEDLEDSAPQLQADVLEW